MNNSILVNGRIPCMDGWRAVSIALVVFSHSRIAHVSGDFGHAAGGIGVRFFFVISGFLITWLLLQESSKGHVSLKNFYIRRILRIFPVYFCFLLVCWLLEISGAALSMTSKIQWIYNVTFLANYGPCEGPTGVLWSLGVEEQFYLLWPIAFVAFQLYRRVRLAIPILLFAILAGPFFRGLKLVCNFNENSILAHRFSFLHHVDMLAIGCLGAIVLWNYSFLQQVIKNNIKSFISVASLLVVVPFLSRNIQGLGIETVFGPGIQAFGFLLLMTASIIGHNRSVFSFLQWKPVVWLGMISYSLYLWHSIFLTGRYFGEGDNFFVVYGLPTSILVASCSYYLLELPILKLRHRFRSKTIDT